MASHAKVERGETELLMRQKVSRLLRPTLLDPYIQNKEERHPWSVTESQKLNFPLMRTWDKYSGSIIKGSRMLSRAPDMPLDTEEARKSSLTTHLKHSDWGTEIPYISFTLSAEALEKLASERESKRGKQILTVIDPGTRSKYGLPALDVAAEMDYYSISDPYHQGNQYYINHFICLWEVTPDEVVGSWPWDELAGFENWYKDIVMPKFDQVRMAKYSIPASTISSASTSTPAAIPAFACYAATVSAFNISALNGTLPG
jgi:hypothetical protein